MKILFKRVRANAKTPVYMTAGAAGMDLHAAIEKPVTLSPMQRELIPTGISMAVPEGFEGQVRARSGLALNLGVGVVNAPGSIDSDYRGEIGVLLINLGQDLVVVQPGDRIGQIMLVPVARAELVETDELDKTERGLGGFGSTG